MKKLDIAISSIKYSLEVSEEEAETFLKIVKSLNEKTNELMMRTGKISDRLLLFVILLINMNKQEKIFNNFEENIAKLLKKSAPLLLNRDNNLDSQLILASIISENNTENIVESKEKEPVIDKDLLEKLEENNKTNQQIIQFIDEAIKVIEKLANNIDSF